jgi:ribosomal protein RSM22 (predicted rRNA methylase)
MQGSARDWCHFSERLERSAAHRRLKGAELGYEDEKFSYVVASKLPARKAAARIVRHPQQSKGHVDLQLCAPGGLRNQTVTRSQRQEYKQARRAKWGDEWLR